ncbi:MAG: sulfite exporter TauE/SafE family protein [Clostridiales bacterium]|nr:sulfite exporter TauE/SafE family protein [Clostridiales bacterium]
MIITIIYSVVIFISVIIGATVGIGGGAIIKSVLDMIGYHTVDVVNFISVCAVFAMSISSTARHIKAKTKIKPEIVAYVSIGSVLGGIAGNNVFDILFDKFNPNIVKGIQAVILAGFLIFAIIYVNSHLKSFHLQNPFAIIFAGLFLGLIGSFLGIGGGPINTAFLVLFFSFSVKESAVYSVAIIFFSQLSKLITIFINNQFKPYADYLPIIIAAMIVAVIGGLIGSKLNRKLSDKVITRVFTLTLVFVIAVNVVNAVKGFTA